MLSLRIATLLNVCTLFYWETYGTPSIRYEYTHNSPFWNVRSWGNAFVREDQEVGVMSFEKIIEIVLQHEGGYVNDKDDKGGET